MSRILGLSNSGANKALFAAGLVILISVLVLVGWAFDIATLKSVLPGYITMKANTAVCLFLLATSLIILRQETRNPWDLTFATGFCLLVFIIACLTLSEYLWKVDFSIDQLLFQDRDGLGGRFPPGRLAPITAINFILVSLSLALQNIPAKPFHRTAQFFLALAFLASFQGLVGYFIGLTYLFGSAFYTQIALHTAVSFILLTVGILVSRPHVGFGAILGSLSASAVMSRRMLIGVIVIPPLVRWIANYGFRLSLYDHDFETLIQVIGSTVLMALIVVISFKVLLGSESEKQQLARREYAASQAALKSQEVESVTAKRLQLIANSLPALVGYILPDEKYLFANQTYEKWFGIPAEEIVGKTMSEVIGAHNRSRVQGMVAKVFSSGETVIYENTFELVSGKIIAYHASYVPDLDPKTGRARGCIVLGTDITEHKNIQHELELAKLRAEAANQAKTNFLANISHEIRTPLGAVLGFSELLEEQNNFSAESVDYLNAIKRNGNQLLRLIDDLLDIAKIETGNFNVEKERASFSQILSDLLAFSQLKAAEKKIQFSLNIEEQVPEFIVTDPVRLKQCLMNVVGNAIKFTDPKGQVCVTVHNHSDRSPNIEICVKDTGIGLSAETGEKLFQPFSQADGSSSRKFGGSGLGLALSRQIALALGGNVDVKESAPGLGSVFAITFDSGPSSGVIPVGNFDLHKSPDRS